MHAVPVSQVLSVTLGAVLGAALSTIGQVVLVRRREGGAARAAARLMRLELREADEFLRQSLEAGGWVSEPKRVLSNEQWAEQRAVWAITASDADFDAVGGAFLAIAGVRRDHRDATPGDDLGGDQQVRWIEEVVGRLPDARRRLGES